MGNAPCHLMAGICIMLALAAGAVNSQGLQRQTTPFDAESRARVEGQAKRIRFDGAIMTRAKAQRMIDPLGWTLVDIHPCGDNRGECVEMTVVKRNGNVFRYMLSEESCIRRPRSEKVAPAQTDRPRLNDGGPTKARRPLDDLKRSDAGGRRKPRDMCIARKTVLARVRVENAILVTPDGNFSSFDYTFQMPENGSWKDEAAISYASWASGLVSPPGGYYEGESWQLIDGAGHVVDSGLEEHHRIDALPETSASAEARCEARANALGTQAEVGRSLPADACKLIDPEKIDFLILEFDLGFCDMYSNIVAASMAEARAEFIDTCLANPDYVLSETASDDVIALELITFEDPGTLAISQPLACENYTEKGRMFEADGWICWADWYFVCNETKGGGCNCTPAAITSDTIECVNK